MKGLFSFFLVFILALNSSIVCAVDFGVLLDTGLSAEGKSPVENPAFNVAVIPWFTTFWGDNADLYVSVRAAASGENKELTFAPELYRTELDLRFADIARLKAGRMYYSDPLGFIAVGLFDGAQFGLNAGGGKVYLGGWYTGLLYKKTANITMNSGDTGEYDAGLDYGNFYHTYFASKRIVAAIGAEHPAFAGLAKVKTAIIGQADLNRLDSGRNSRIHSQYFSGKVSIPLGPRFIVEGGGALELSELTSGGFNGAVTLAGAAEAGLIFLASSSFRDHLTLTGRFASGGDENGAGYGAFTPITTTTQGNILQARLSGLSVLQAEYVTRLLPELSADLSAAFFFKDARRPYANRNFLGGEGYFLGFEQYAKIIWNPASDIKVNIGGGAFVPRNDSDPVWKVSLGVMAAVF